MKLNKLIGVFALTTVLVACDSADKEPIKDEKTDTPNESQTNTEATETEKPENAGVVTGTIKNGAGRAIYLEHLPVGSRDFKILDQAMIADDGSYTLTSGVDYLEFYRLRVEPSSAPPQQEYANLIMDANDHVTMNAEADNLLGTFALSGNEYSNKLQTLFNDIFRPYQTVVDSLNKAANLAEESEKGQYIAQLNEYNERTKNRIIEIVDANMDNPIGYFAHFRLISLRMSLQEDISIEELDKFDEIVHNLKLKMPKSFVAVEAESYARQIRARVEKLKAQNSPDALLAKGSPAPELAFANPEGKVMKLSDLKGKYVLIDFWASWCKPCRMANPHVVKLYEKYHDKGFEIFSVSLDQNRDRWIQAIAADKLTWPYHVSDLKGWQSEGARLYGITSIPQTVLVDTEGNILAKGSEIAVNVGSPDPDALLKKKLESIFGF